MANKSCYRCGRHDLCCLFSQGGKAIKKMEGVVDSSVNLLAQKATIEYDEDKVNIDSLVKTIEKTGYEVPVEKTTLLVEGMTCAACSARVEKVLNRLDGVIKANVNLSTNKAIVEHPSGAIEEETLVKAVEKAGYKAEVEKEVDRDREKELRERR